MPIPYRVLDSPNNSGVELLANGFIVSKKDCCECIFDPFIDLIMEDREEIVDVVVDYFVEGHRLPLSEDRHGNCGDFGLDELMDIGIVSVLLVSEVDINVVLALKMVGCFRFHNSLVELNFRRNTLERR